MLDKGTKVCVVGLGYVGLPLCIELSKCFDLIGYDISENRINDLKNNFDHTNEIDSIDLELCSAGFTHNLEDSKDSEIYIITVPTPIDKDHNPDLSLLKKASSMVGQHLNKDNIVIYESTVYPGATEEICVPLLEENSKLKFNEDFFVGYSPERINPGDKEHTIRKITKIISGSNSKTLERISELYSQIIDAGIFPVDSIRIAEAAKVIENTQRDVNIALINEFAKIFALMNIDTESVLDAAETKWNFLPFRPGLVGGHCIGVDPYYLTFKAQSMGYDPELTLAGRSINDGMPSHIVDRLNEAMNLNRINMCDADILIMGYTFKENCNDTRNTKVKDLYDLLLANVNTVSIFDPKINKYGLCEGGMNFIEKPIRDSGNYDVVIIAVGHSEFREMGIDHIRSFCKKSSIIFDLKYLFSKDVVDIRL